jgi:acetyl esterase/lipase
MIEDKYLKVTVLVTVVYILVISNIASAQVFTDDDITVYEDVVYAVVDGHELKLDIAIPKYLKSPAPAIMDIPGGAWRRIRKGPEDAKFYAEFGYIGVSILHRTSDIAIFPAAVHDCKTVIRWLRANAKKYNINPDKIGVTGMSSGGHLATLLGTSGGDTYLEGNGGYAEFSSSVQAVVDHFGPTDFLAMEEEGSMSHVGPDSAESLFLGKPIEEIPEIVELANPITYLDSSDPPILIGHGIDDGMVPISQSELLFEALNKINHLTDFIRVKNADHMYRKAEWDKEISPSINEIIEVTMAWFSKYLGDPEIDFATLEAAKEKRKGIIKKTDSVPLFYRVEFSLPGMATGSYCKGEYTIRFKGKILAGGKISIDDFSKKENLVFSEDVVITAEEMLGNEILFNFIGQIYDAKLDEKFEPMFMQGTILDDTVSGVGFTIQIKADGAFSISKKVYKK